MKMKKLTVALIMAGSFVAVTQAYAGTTPSTHGGSGTIHFVGNINDGACNIDATSMNQTVALPSIKASQLHAAGDKAGETTFTLKLKDCDISVYHTAHVKLTGFSGTNGAPTGTFSGSIDPNSAQNVGLEIRDWAGAELHPGVESSSWGVAAGSEELAFTAAYKASAAAKPGKFDATVNFNIDYQ